MLPLEQVAVLLTLMREIESLMRKESALLSEMRLAHLPALQADKALMLDAYRIELRALRRSPEAVASLPAGVRATLEQATRDFQVVVRANVQSLLIGRAAVEAVQRGLNASLAAIHQPQRLDRGSAGAACTGQVIALPLERLARSRGETGAAVGTRHRSRTTRRRPAVGGGR